MAPAALGAAVALVARGIGGAGAGFGGGGAGLRLAAGRGWGAGSGSTGRCGAPGLGRRHTGTAPYGRWRTMSAKAAPCGASPAGGVYVVSGVIHIENTPPKPKNHNFTVRCFPAQLKVSMD